VTKEEILNQIEVLIVNANNEWVADDTDPMDRLDSLLEGLEKLLRDSR